MVIGMLFILVAYAGGNAVFCSDRDYSAVINNPTGFCVATGEFTIIINTYWVGVH